MSFLGDQKIQPFTMPVYEKTCYPENNIAQFFVVPKIILHNYILSNSDPTYIVILPVDFLLENLRISDPPLGNFTHGVNDPINVLIKDVRMKVVTSSAGRPLSHWFTII